MRVGCAINVFNHDVKAALELLSDKFSRPEWKTTSWFIGVVRRWFQIMSSRNLGSVLGKLHVDKYDEAINFLKEVIDIVSLLKVGNKEHWKPFQIAVIISTTSMIKYQHFC